MINHSAKRAQPVCVLTSYDEFCNWYLQRFDLSIFSENDIDMLLEEVKPTSYPCIPFIAGETQETVFIDVREVEAWFKAINQHSMSHYIITR